MEQHLITLLVKIGVAASIASFGVRSDAVKRMLLREERTLAQRVRMALWFAAIFVSFGLFAPPNASVTITLFVCALSVAGSIYLIVEMDQPYGGLIKLSSAPVVTALEQIDRQ